MPASKVSGLHKATEGQGRRQEEEEGKQEGDVGLYVKSVDSGIYPWLIPAPLPLCGPSPVDPASRPCTYMGMITAMGLFNHCGA